MRPGSSEDAGACCDVIALALVPSHGYLTLFSPRCHGVDVEVLLTDAAAVTKRAVRRIVSHVGEQFA